MKTSVFAAFLGLGMVAIGRAWDIAILAPMGVGMMVVSVVLLLARSGTS
jgi:hypothetical protein